MVKCCFYLALEISVVLKRSIDYSLFLTLLNFVFCVSQVAEMSLAQRVLLTWVFTLVFLITLVLKLDGKVVAFWNHVFSMIHMTIVFNNVFLIKFNISRSFLGNQIVEKLIWLFSLTRCNGTGS